MLRHAPVCLERPSMQHYARSWVWAPDRQWRRSDGPGKVTTLSNSVRQHGRGSPGRMSGRYRTLGSGIGRHAGLSGPGALWC